MWTKWNIWASQESYGASFVDSGVGAGIIDCMVGCKFVVENHFKQIFTFQFSVTFILIGMKSFWEVTNTHTYRVLYISYIREKNSISIMLENSGLTHGLEIKLSHVAWENNKNNKRQTKNMLSERGSVDLWLSKHPTENWRAQVHYLIVIFTGRKTWTQDFWNNILLTVHQHWKNSKNITIWFFSQCTSFISKVSRKCRVLGFWFVMYLEKRDQ